MSYWLNLAIAIDQLLNAIFRMEVDETLLSRAWSLKQERGLKYPRFQLM